MLKERAVDKITVVDTCIINNFSPKFCVMHSGLQ